MSCCQSCVLWRQVWWFDENLDGKVGKLPSLASWSSSSSSSSLSSLPLFLVGCLSHRHKVPPHVLFRINNIIEVVCGGGISCAGSNWCVSWLRETFILHRKSVVFFECFKIWSTFLPWWIAIIYKQNGLQCFQASANKSESIANFKHLHICIWNFRNQHGSNSNMISYSKSDQFMTQSFEQLFYQFVFQYLFSSSQLMFFSTVTSTNICPKRFFVLSNFGCASERIRGSRLSIDFGPTKSPPALEQGVTVSHCRLVDL